MAVKRISQNMYFRIINDIIDEISDEITNNEECIYDDSVIEEIIESKLEDLFYDIKLRYDAIIIDDNEIVEKDDFIGLFDICCMIERIKNKTQTVVNSN